MFSTSFPTFILSLSEFVLGGEPVGTTWSCGRTAWARSAGKAHAADPGDEVPPLFVTMESVMEDAAGDGLKSEIVRGPEYRGIAPRFSSVERLADIHDRVGHDMVRLGSAILINPGRGRNRLTKGVAIGHVEYDGVAIDILDMGSGEEVGLPVKVAGVSGIELFQDQSLNVSFRFEPLDIPDKCLQLFAIRALAISSPFGSSERALAAFDETKPPDSKPA